MSELPQFERVAEHVYQKGEKIYVIDENDYDIYAAHIHDVKENAWDIHFPEYPDDDKVFNTTSRFLVSTPVNDKIFEEQDKIRLELEKETEDEEEEFQEEEEKKPTKKKK